MRKKPGMVEESESGVLSTSAWLLIFLAVLFLVYVFVPPVREFFNGIFGSVFSPIIEMLDLASNTMKYVG